jgi:zinc transport system substrate-binding protein
MKNKLLALILFVTVVSVATVAIVVTQKGNNKEYETGKLPVATSFYPVYFFSTLIGGDKADVKVITPAGSEPHDYDPSTRDIASIENSKLFVINGGIEPWAEKIKDSLTKTTVLTAGEGLFQLETTDADGETVRDPHIWLSPERAKKMVENIYSGFVRTDPENSDYFMKNRDLLLDKLTLLDTSYKQALGMCSTNKIITSHEAFGYMAADYGLEQVAISGLSSEEEPSAKQLADVTAFARENAISFIFFESLVSPKLSETIANEVGAKTMVLDPLEGISDADAANGRDYFSVMNENLNNLKTALVCQP